MHFIGTGSFFLKRLKIAMGNLLVFREKRYCRGGEDSAQLHDHLAFRTSEWVIAKGFLNHISPERMDDCFSGAFHVQEVMNNGQKFSGHSVGKEAIVSDASEVLIGDMND